jgi:hypothetical protein
VVTYAFYKDSYLGSAIPENAFSGVAARGAAALAKMKRIYEIRSGGEMAEKLAVCAMAEAIYQYEDRKQEVLQASMGEVSVRYTDPGVEKKNLSRELYRRACIYLDIYRGVAG